jgi:hypothetical protein
MVIMRTNPYNETERAIFIKKFWRMSHAYRTSRGIQCTIDRAISVKSGALWQIYGVRLVALQ